MLNSAPSGLKDKEHVVPPVAPEVINIFLLQRSSRLPDALTEHVVASEISVKVIFLYPYCPAPTELKGLEGEPYLRLHRRLLISFSFREAAGCPMLLRSMSLPEYCLFEGSFINHYRPAAK